MNCPQKKRAASSKVILPSSGSLESVIGTEGGTQAQSQASSGVEEFNSSCLSSCSRGDRPLVDVYVELAGFSNDAGGCQTPSFCAFVHRIAFEEVS